jgi:protein gp37
MNNTSIEWTDATWNPVTGCSPVSAGCQNCWAKRMAKRLAGRCGYPADDPFRVTFHPNRLDEPLRMKKPKRIAVSLMGDFFHDDVPDEWIDDVFSVMVNARHHRYLLLTKRPERMWRYLQGKMWKHLCRTGVPEYIWLGVSVENQKTADERIPWLLKCPAAVRFISTEPLLGPVNFRWKPYQHQASNESYREYLERKGSINHLESLSGIHWVIVGGESGPNARPMHPSWVRTIRDQCQAAGVPFFLKQIGEWVPYPGLPYKHFGEWGIFHKGVFHRVYTPHDGRNRAILPDGDTAMIRVPKKAAGRLLDGREWNDMPEVAR